MGLKVFIDSPFFCFEVAAVDPIVCLGFESAAVEKVRPHRRVGGGF